MVGDQSKSAWETEYFSGKIIPLDLLCNTKAVLCFTLTLHWGRGACCARGPGFLGAWIKNTSESAYTHNRARAHSNPPTQLLPPLCLPLRTCSELCSDFWFSITSTQFWDRSLFDLITGNNLMADLKIEGWVPLKTQLTTHPGTGAERQRKRRTDTPALPATWLTGPVCTAAATHEIN